MGDLGKGQRSHCLSRVDAVFGTKYHRDREVSGAFDGWLPFSLVSNVRVLDAIELLDMTRRLEKDVRLVVVGSKFSCIRFVENGAI